MHCDRKIKLSRIHDVYLEILQHSKLILLTVQLKGYSKKTLNAVEPQAVICRGYLQAVKPESLNTIRGISVTMCLSWWVTFT